MTIIDYKNITVTMGGSQSTPEAIQAYDAMTKDELMERIKSLELKTLVIDDTYHVLAANVTLENTQLIPLSVELYEKLAAVLPEFHADPNKPVTLNRTFYVKPGFTAADLRAHVDALPNAPATITPLMLDTPAKPTILCVIDKITLEEFNAAFNDPAPSKDMIGISKRMLQNAPPYIKTRLINTYNSLYSRKNPDDVRRIAFGRASYAYKQAKRGPKEKLNSYREIIAIPNSVTHFHRIMALRLVAYLEKNNYLDTNIQKGGIAGIRYSIFEQVYKVKNVIKDANKNKKEAYILFLDISNAFGSLHLKQLLHIMRLYTIPEEFVTYVEQYYTSFQFYSKINGEDTGMINWKDGLMQGCPLSPTLFVLVINYVLTYLDKKFKTECGYEFATTKIMLTAFVDDITVICKSWQGMNKVYRELKTHMAQIGLNINPDKSAIMVINPSAEIEIKVPIVQNQKYLGEYLSSDGNSTYSYKQFIVDLGRKLNSLEKKKILPEEKFAYFTHFLLPWVQRKQMVMYDISKQEKINIVSLIKKFASTWGDVSNIEILNEVHAIIDASKDEVIAGIPIEENFDEGLTTDTELMNNIIHSTVPYSYTSVREDEELVAADEVLVTEEIEQGYVITE